MSISRLPPRILRPLASSGLIDRVAAARQAAGLPDPGQHDDALAGQEVAELLADRRGLPGGALRVGAHQPGHQPDIELGKLAARIGDRIEAHIERTFAHRRELRNGLHQRRVRIDLRPDRAVGALLELGRELETNAIAEIAFVDGAAGKLVGNLQHLGRRCRAEPSRGDDGGRRDCAEQDMTSTDGHVTLPSGRPLWSSGRPHLFSFILYLIAPVRQLRQCVAASTAGTAGADEPPRPLAQKSRRRKPLRSSAQLSQT